MCTRIALSRRARSVSALRLTVVRAKSLVAVTKVSKPYKKLSRCYPTVAGLAFRHCQTALQTLLAPDVSIVAIFASICFVDHSHRSRWLDRYPYFKPVTTTRDRYRSSAISLSRRIVARDFPRTPTVDKRTLLNALGYHDYPVQISQFEEMIAKKCSIGWKYRPTWECSTRIISTGCLSLLGQR